MKIFLEQQLERTNYWLSFAETKNGVLVAFNIAIIAVVAQIDKIPLEMQAVICILFSLSTLICFFSFFSNLRNKINNKEGENIDEFNLLFYNDIAKIKDTDMYLNALKGRYNLKIKENEKKLYEDFITEIVINSEIAVYNYNCLYSGIVLLFSFKWYRLKARHSYIKRIWLYKYNCRKRTRTARWYFPNLSIS